MSSASILLQAVRALVKARAFTAVCVGSLGLGMGAVIAIFVLVRALLGTPPGIDTEGLVEAVIRPTGPLRAQAGDAIVETWSYPDYVDLRDAVRDLSVTGWALASDLVRWDLQGSAPTPTMYVSSNYFSTVGVTLARGRGLTPADDASLAEPEVVISHRVWQTRFGSDPDVVGRVIAINHTQYVVVGVAPEGYRGHLSPERGNPQLYLPLSRHARLAAADSARASRDRDWIRIVARLSAATSVAQADARVRSVMSALAERYGATNQHKAGGVEPYFPLGPQARSDVALGLVMLFGLSGMVLLVVCLNISGMMLVRGAIRERELAIRLAIGASRWRLALQNISEAFVLAVLGGCLASALLFGAPAVASWWFDLWSPVLDFFTLDGWLILQCIAVCFVTTLVLGFLPALRFSRPSIIAALKNDSAGSGWRVGRFQRLTAAAQAGIAVPFLVVGGVKLDQARVTMMAELGFKPQGLYAATLNLATLGQTEGDRRTFTRTVLENLAQAAGVWSVSVGDGLPLDFRYRATRVAAFDSVRGAPAGAAAPSGESAFFPAHVTRIGAGYLDAVGIRLLAGRAIVADDREGGELVVMLSEPLARQLFPAGDPLGARVTFALAGSESRTHTVVGVTGDLVSHQMGNPRPQLFVALTQHPSPTVVAIARGAASDAAMRPAFENAIKAAHPDFVLPNIVTGESLIDRSRSDLMSQSAVGGALAGIALILAALGVYGVIGFMVAMRTREIGVRMALGATRVRVLNDVLGDALKLVVPGVGLGLVIAVLWVRIADPSWYALGGVEPLVYSFAAVTAFLVAVIAGIPSARRAASVDAAVVLRQ